MRLPGFPLAFAVGVLLPISLAGAEARAAAHEPVLTTNCMESGDPRTADDVLPAPAARPLPVPTPLDARRLAEADSYQHVFRILTGENPCSRFFGGPAKAAEAFNQFARQLSLRRLDDPRVAVRMSGDYTRYVNNETGAAYRLFDKATINSEGPLGVGRASRVQIGRYAAHTPQARALVLLHELGHLVEGPAGDWLLPNDGGDGDMSERNTRKVEAHCSDQLKAIRD